MMKLSFVIQPKASYSASYLDQWCESQQKAEEGAVERLQRHLAAVPAGGAPVTVRGNITFRHLEVDQLTTQTFGNFDENLVKEINELALMLEDLNELMSDVDTLSLAYTSDAVTVKGEK